MTFAEGENEAVISLTIVQDNTPEPAEMFMLRLHPEFITGSARVEGLTTANLLLQDSDNMYGTVELGPGTEHRLLTVG